MLCQNCKRNDAAVHIRRIVSGESAEIHLCTGCAVSMGLSDSAISFFHSGNTSGNISPASEAKSPNRHMRCEICGFSFEDIMNTGSLGCAGCYRVFSAKLRPVLNKIHGRAVHKGKIPSFANENILRGKKIEALKEKLNIAVAQQEFELAAVLRDEIKKLSEGEN